MKVVTYTNTRAPDGFQVLGLVFFETGEASAIRFNGRTVEAVRAKAEAYIVQVLAEREKQPKRVPPRKAKAGAE